MANHWFLLTLAVFSAYCASAQAQSCPSLPSSCQEIYDNAKCANKTATDGVYKISFMSNGNRVVREVYCDMTTPFCGPEKGWMRVAELDMTLAGSKCPPGLDEGMYGTKKLCGNRGTNVCKSTIFNTYGYPHTEVCGFVAGYQDKTPGAFLGRHLNIDSVYLDGISITRGMPRKHIWSLPSGYAANAVGVANCPCNRGGTDNKAAFVKDNYYCESGNPTASIIFRFFPNDVLWDGKQCTQREPPCCQHPTMPYFRTGVDGVSTDSIELRICHDQEFADEDVPLESYKFFVR